MIILLIAVLILVLLIFLCTLAALVQNMRPGRAIDLTCADLRGTRFEKYADSVVRDVEELRAHGWPVRFFSAEALERLEGEFTGSPFVKRTVGVDNVCERSAALASGGALIGKKYVFGGVTLAMAQKPYEMDWTW